MEEIQNSLTKIETWENYNLSDPEKEKIFKNKIIKAKILKKTEIIGLGLLGSSLAAAFRKYKVTENIIGITRSETYKKALKDGLIDEGYPIDKIKAGVPVTNDEVQLVINQRDILADAQDALEREALINSQSSQLNMTQQ